MTDLADKAAAAPAPGAWAPLRQPMFRALWLALLLSNIGTWFNDVAASWWMTETTGSPLLVGLVQASATVPVVLLALLAGALADIVDRRRYLLAAQLWMLCSASALALLAHLGLLAPWSLLALTFALGIGTAMAMPAQAAVVPELVPRPMLSSAVALGSLGINIARAIGPALGGLILAQFGTAAAFALNALSFVALIAVLAAWRPTPAAQALPAEALAGAMVAGLRYVTAHRLFQSVLWRAAGFFVFASALPALLPLLVRQQLRADAGFYGLALGAIGLGAIAGALLLPWLRARFDRDRLIALATLVYAAAMAGATLLAQRWLLPPLMLVAGVAWICVLASLQVAAQTSVAAWVRARALSLYLLVFSAGMAAGSLGWGAVAQAWRVDAALLLAAAGAVLGVVFGRRHAIAAAEQLDVTPSAHWPQPLTEGAIEHDRGPVLIAIAYRMPPAARERFLALMAELGRSRRRDGASAWGVYEDTQAPGQYLETFTVPSWLDHLRQHARVTGEERRLQQAIRALLDADPAVRHYVGGAPGPLPMPPDDHRD